MGMCGLGPKAFAVLGGVVNLYGMPYNADNEVCPTWMMVEDTATMYTQEPANSPAAPIAESCGAIFVNPGMEDMGGNEPIPAECGMVFANPSIEEVTSGTAIPPECGAVFLNPGLEAGLSPSSWSKTGGTMEVVQDPSAIEGSNVLSMTGRTAGWQGPGQFLDTSCLTAGQNYVISVAWKLPANAQCFATGETCVKIILRWKKDGVNRWRWIGEQRGGSAKAGEWNTLTATQSFPAEQLAAEEFFMYFEAPEVIDVSYDAFGFSLPPAVPAGWTKNGASFEARTDPALAHGGSAFLLMYNRGQTWHAPGQYLDTSCLTADQNYVISASWRLPAGAQCLASGSWCLKVLLRWKDGAGNNHWRNLAQALDGVDDAWNTLTNTVSFPAEQLAAQEFYVYFEFSNLNDAMLDSVSFSIPPPGNNPTAQNCLDVELRLKPVNHTKLL